MPWKTATVSLKGRYIATYWHGWHEGDPASSVEEITQRSLRSAWEEDLLAEQDVDEAEVSISVELYDALPDEVANRLDEAWERTHDGSS